MKKAEGRKRRGGPAAGGGRPAREGGYEAEAMAVSVSLPSAMVSK
jgi:hypothetical protein